MAKSLVIVESPTKAKTLARFLGSDYVVESSVGHVRDLPAKAAEIPAKFKKTPWARMGVNVEDDFQPLYVIQPGKTETIKKLKKLAASAREILLATDEDREGEAISWHLLEVLKPKVPVKRMVFHEITRAAITESLDHIRGIDENLVSAQETRRIIDRLYGYEVSPILWRKVAPRLSAGRVQSVAVRLVVEREQERIRFRPSEYWDLVATFSTDRSETFESRLSTIGGRRLAQGKDFDPETGSLAKRNIVHLRADDARLLAEALEGASFRVISVEEKPFKRSPAPPFATSTLQQEGNRKLRFDAKRTMRAAQQLYENGYITYMRTDSFTLSQEALDLARKEVLSSYGPEFLPEKPRMYRHKVKNAQEAHEAIRPAGERIRSVDEVRAKLGDDAAKVYELIRKRTLACQMTDAQGRRMTVQVEAEVPGLSLGDDGSFGSGASIRLVFQATGSTIDFPGFLRAYVEGSDSPGLALGERESLLPPVSEGEPVQLAEAGSDAEDPRNPLPEKHVTTPPARLTEASLVKILEESGIGRPSTYASIIDTILRRKYVFRKGNALVPTFTAFAVVRLMKEHLKMLVDVGFTAEMEDRLDEISRGERDSLPYLKDFYFGNGLPGLQPLLERKAEEIDARAVCTIALARHGDPDAPAVDPENGEIVVRVGRYGPYVQRGEETASLPDEICPDELDIARAEELLAHAAQADRPLGSHPETGEPIYRKNGRFGPYVQLGDPDPEDKKKRPKTASLIPPMTLETLTLEQAVSLLRLPRVLGQDEAGVDVVAHNGRFGPYIKRGEDTRSLAPEDDVLAVELSRALELLAQEKKGRGFRRQATPIKTFEKVEELGSVDVLLLPGRYGPYLTDGEVNASLPRDVGDPATLSLERAIEIVKKKRESKGKSGAKGKAKTKAKTKAKRKAKTKAKAKARKKAA